MKEELKPICHLCGVETEKVIDKIEVIDGSGVYEEAEFYRCLKCGEEFMDSEQIKELRKKIDIVSIKRKLGVSGNALVLKIPKNIQDYYGLEKEDIVEIIPINKHRFIVEVD